MHSSNADLHISKKGVALITSYEGWYSTAYRDPVGVWTIGWGTTNEGSNGHVVWEGRTISKELGVEYLRRDMLEHEKYVKNYVLVPLNQHQFDAMVSVMYNMGPGNFRKTPFLKALNNGNYEAVPGLLERHNTATDRRTGQKVVLRGLTRRRVSEGVLFTTNELPLIHSKRDDIVLHDDGESAGPESRITPEGFNPAPEALENTLGSDTFKTHVMTWTGILGAVSATLKPLMDNYLAMGFVLLAVAGLALAFYIKYRDTREGR